jgi:hypothetical protein
MGEWVGLNIFTYFVEECSGSEACVASFLGPAGHGFEGISRDKSEKTGPVLWHAMQQLSLGEWWAGLSRRLIMVLHFVFKRLHGTPHVIAWSKTLFHPIQIVNIEHKAIIKSLLLWVCLAAIGEKPTANLYMVLLRASWSWDVRPEVRHC